MKVCAGVVTYNPNILRLRENFNSISIQVSQIFVVDNNSKNIGEIEEVINEYSNIILIKNRRNEGIAYALNRILINSYKQGFKWVLTLDQDSICNNDLVEEYVKRLSNDQIGMLCSNINDLNLGILEGIEDNIDKEVDFCITSGSLLSVKAWKEVGGFDNELFIDRVDTDMCYSLVNKGYKIVKISYTGLIHEIGSGKVIKVLGKNIYLYNHSDFRRYYINRNAIIISKRYAKTTLIHEIFYLLNRTILILIYEDNKAKKLYSGMKGIIDGLTFKHPRKIYCNEERYK